MLFKPDVNEQQRSIREQLVRQLVLEELFSAVWAKVEDGGYVWSDPDGVERHVFPVIAIVAGDYPELRLLCGHQTGPNATLFCPMCYVSRMVHVDPGDPTAMLDVPLRSDADIIELLEQTGLLPFPNEQLPRITNNIINQFALIGARPVPLALWNDLILSRMPHPLGSVTMRCPPDGLHNNDLGVFKDLVKRLVLFIKDRTRFWKKVLTDLNRRIALCRWGW